MRNAFVRRSADVSGHADVSITLNSPGRKKILCGVTRPDGSSRTSAGILNTTQCQKPLPVGASIS